MVSDMIGCSGSEAVGVTMRELFLGLVSPKDAMRVWMKEVYVGVINGIVLGILIGIVCWIWKGNPYLGLVIGLALALNTIIAVSIRGATPAQARRPRSGRGQWPTFDNDHRYGWVLLGVEPRDTHDAATGRLK